MNPYDVNKEGEVKKLLILATLAARIMIKSGAETYRVEDTVERICRSRKGIQYVDVLVTATGIFISLELEGELVTYIQRIKSTAINLNKIDLVNEFSRKFVSTDMSLDDGIKELREISRAQLYTEPLRVVCGSLTAASFAVLFGGNYLDFISSFIATYIMLFTLNKLSKLELTFFINNLIGSTMVTLLSFVLMKIGLGSSLDHIIIGSIMPLVPGVAITTAIRDTMSGDHLAGLSKGMEAVFSAFAIAIGVGVVLNFYIQGVM